MTSGIYLILNKTNAKIYVGSTRCFKARFATHKHSLKLNKHANKYLQAAWNKYGEENFEFRIIDHVEKDKRMLADKEQYWVDKLKSYDRSTGYNLRKIVESNLGYKHSEENKIKNSNAHKGLIQSEESKLKKSLKLTGRKLSEENKRNIGLANKGRKFNFPKDRVSKLKGRKLSEEIKAKMSKAHRTNGYKHSVVSKEKIWKNRNEKFFQQLTAVPLSI